MGFGLVLAILTAVGAASATGQGARGQGTREQGARAQGATGPLTVLVDPSASRPGMRVAGRVTVNRLDEALAVLARSWTGAARSRPAIIEFTGGVHRFQEAVRIGPHLGGRPGAPLILRGAADGTSRLSGSLPLAIVPHALPPGWDPRQRDRVVAYRLPPIAADRPSIGVHRFHPGPSAPAGLEIFDAQGALTPARWPNEGWARARLPAPQAGVVDKDVIVADAARADRWIGEPDLWVAGYLGEHWSFETLGAVVAIPGSGRIALAQAPHYPLREGDRFFVEHALAELDAPGEWWRDRANGLVFLIPRDAASPVEVSVAPTLLAIEGAKHVLVENLTFERSRGDAVTVKGGEDVVLHNCTIRWAAGRGLVIAGARGAGLRRSVIADTGEGGVFLDGGDRITLTRADNFVQDSLLVRYARLGRTSKDAVAVNGVGMRVVGNVITQAPHHAIRFQGNDHLIAGNEIFDVVNDTSDAGAVYTGRDVTAQGTVIRGNFIHDILPARTEGRTPFEVKGVYLDDLASGTTVTGNLFLRVEQPVFIGGGRDNVVTRNLFVSSSPALFVDGRGKVWPMPAFDSPGNAFYAAWREMPITGSLWAARYPALAGIKGDDPLAAKRNVFRDNVMVASGAPQIRDGARPQDQIVTANREAALPPAFRRMEDVPPMVAALAPGLALPEGFGRLERLLEISPLRARAKDVGLGSRNP